MAKLPDSVKLTVEFEIEMKYGELKIVNDTPVMVIEPGCITINSIITTVKKDDED